MRAPVCGGSWTPRFLEESPLRILALDTATDACSVCLWQDGDMIVRAKVAPREHARLLLPWVREVTAEAGVTLGELDAVAVTAGPGSFTGVRIGFSAAQGLAIGGGVGLVTRSTLETMAETARREDPSRDRILAALDARMDEVYAGAYVHDGGAWATVLADRVAPPESIEVPEGHWRVVGAGAEVHDAALVAAAGPGVTSDPTLLPDASALASLAARFLAGGGEPQAPEQAEPAYLRSRVARKPR